jgi:hypothetical protein
MAEQRPSASPGEPGIIVLSYGEDFGALLAAACDIDQSAVLML